MLREVLDTQKRVLGAEHPNSLSTTGHLANSLAGQGKYAEAEQMQRELLDVQRRVLGPEHPSTLSTAAQLATSFSKQRTHAEVV